MSTSELACTYASFILNDDGLEISADNISTILKAANVEVEAFWPGMFAKLFAKNSIDDLITTVGGGGGGAAAPAAAGGAAPAAAGAAAPAAAKAEEKPESDEDMGFSLFD
eukprot:gene7761-945_t